MNNSQVSEVFEKIAGLLELKGESVFTIRAYQRAARTIRNLDTELEQMVSEGRDLRELPGVGQAISDKIKELVATGGLGYYERLKAEFPEQARLQAAAAEGTMSPQTSDGGVG